MDLQTTYQNTLRFAAHKHSLKEQKVPGTNLPYVVHLSNVAMEIFAAAAHSPGFGLTYALQLALLHDTVEDTETTLEEIAETFGPEVAQGVAALTKNEQLPKDAQMPDSLRRLKTLPKEAGAVKLADRITNLQPPPSHWDDEKKKKYRDEARQILQALQGVNAYLENRLKEKIRAYGQYILSDH